VRKEIEELYSGSLGGEGEEIEREEGGKGEEAGRSLGKQT